MMSSLRGELVVLALGVAMWVTGALEPVEWGRAFTGGGIVFTVSGLTLIAVSLIRRGVQEQLTHGVVDGLDALAWVRT